MNVVFGKDQTEFIKLLRYNPRTIYYGLKMIKKSESYKLKEHAGALDIIEKRLEDKIYNNENMLEIRKIL